MRAVHVEVEAANDAWAGAVLTHPHPDFGGDRFNAVIDALYRRLPAAGIATLRFDFSSSDLSIAAAETLDAMRHLPIRPLVLVGYSFGADVAVSIDDERVAGWFLVAPPLIDAKRPRPVATDPRPKAIVLPEHDQFSSPGRSSHITERWVNAAVAFVPGADHFLVGHTQPVVDHALGWFRATFIPSPPAD